MIEHRLLLFRLKDKQVEFEWNEQYFHNVELVNPIFLVGYKHDGISPNIVKEVMLSEIDKQGIFVGDRKWVDKLRKFVEVRLPKNGPNGVKLVTIRKLPNNTLWENVDLVESMNYKNR